MKKLQIAVGIIRNPQGEIFITQRAADAHMANKLEFPGGKIESDETPEQALIRELQEEVGITVTASSLFERFMQIAPLRDNAQPKKGTRASSLLMTQSTFTGRTSSKASTSI
mgnify:CR=1 FL=1